VVFQLSGTGTQPPEGSLYADLRSLLSQPTLSPRPWELIFNRGSGRRFTSGEPVDGVPDPNSLRIVDAENCLLIRIAADPEQALKAEDMQLIVAAINALPDLLDRND
jgi:hypothetical protein